MQVTTMVGFLSALMEFFWLDCWVHEDESHCQGSMMAICLSYVRFYSLKLANKEVGTRRPTCKLRLGFMCHNMVMSFGWQTHRRRSWIWWTVGSRNCCISSWSYFDDILIYSSLGKSSNITRDWCCNGCGNAVCTPSLASVSFEYRRLLSSGM